MSDTLGMKITIVSLLKFTLPSMIMMIVISLYTVVDGMFVSRLINTDAFSAVNIIYPLMSFIIAIGTMFGAGTAAIVSTKLGEGNEQEANESLTFIIIVSLLLGLLISAVIFMFLKEIIYGLGANAAVYGYCHDYALPLLFFLPASIVQLAFQSLFVANGKPHIGLSVTILGGIVNIALDYYFIAICGMGISGAAIATGIGYCIPALYGIGYFLWNKSGNLHFVKPKIDFAVVYKAMTNGSSEMVSNISTSVTTFMLNITMMHFIGQDGVAAIAILLYLDFVIIAINLGYSMGVAPLFSYNYGCGNTETLRHLYTLSVAFCMTIGIGMTAGTFFYAHELASIFADEGTKVYTVAVSGLRIFSFGYLFKGFNIFSSALFTAFSNGKISALLSFMRTLVLLVLALFALTALFGVDGVWYASPLAEFLAMLIAVYCTAKFYKTYFYSIRPELSAKTSH